MKGSILFLHTSYVGINATSFASSVVTDEVDRDGSGIDFDTAVPEVGPAWTSTPV